MANKNLIRFDWAMKRLLRNKANFDVLEGFLSVLLKFDIKIHRILDNESNPITSDDKYNRVDILAENQKGEIFIIEIQNQSELDYFHRMAYGTSKVITEYLTIGQEYKDVKKVYSVNIVYFDLGHGKDYVYYGTNDFYGIHEHDKLLLLKNQKIKFDRIEPKDIFPEYYVIKVNSFNDIAKDTLDEWIYYLKNNEIKDSFKAKGLEKVRMVLKYDNLSEKDKPDYNKYLENLRYKASMAWSIKAEEEIRIQEEAEKKGMEIGIEKEKKKVAYKLILKGFDNQFIMETTGLDEKQIEYLRTLDEYNSEMT
ncbi:MAG: Rpn family recombination-promoting nuclease/putative transposase [Bacteroidales bacterium]|nr:Rpn family recombination-promoting nuclease/putative transposase [Bacteroidales bacterium]